ncbi:MAG: glutathione S-transferase [Crocinitomicaceae bacterium]|jgi:glutathione S-transferase|nr:glutathione S-transferase [Crocinitomicaceae bacterium]MBT7951961.1 glutathione S-transferase [Gammaproteobacteria bacterium]
MSGHPILYSFRRCPYAIRGRIALAAANIKCELREVVLSDKPAEMLAISAKGTVPVLQLDDGQVIDESLDVMHWALQQSDPEHWLNVNEDETQLLIKCNDGEFKQNLDRYKYFNRYPEHSQEYYRKQAEAFLLNLEEHLQVNNGSGLVANKLSLADIAIFPFIRQFSRVDYDWFLNSPYHETKQWLSHIEESQRFQNVMKKYLTWTNTNKIEYFP